MRSAFILIACGSRLSGRLDEKLYCWIGIFLNYADHSYNFFFFFNWKRDHILKGREILRLFL